MLYLAKSGNSIVYLTRDEQMDEYLADGASIYQETDGGRRTLIATPDEGFIKPRPVFPVPTTIQLGGN